MTERTADLKRTASGLETAVAPPPSSWLPLIWVSALLLVAHARTLAGVAGSWFDEFANMEHGVLVPLAAGYMVWLKRDALAQIPASPTGWGIVLVVWGMLQSLLGTAAQWVWASRTAFLITLMGCVWTLYGFRMVRAIAYPLGTLVLMVAPPTFIYERVMLQLQLLASRLGEISLEALGYSVLREGNILELVGERLAVAEACSGIRSLLALTFLAVVYNYFFVPQKGIRIIMLAGVGPIAILCNAARIMATGVVGQYNRELAHGMLHATFGYFGLVFGAVLLYLMHRFLAKMWPLEGAH